jgi:hypothetical protein
MSMLSSRNVIIANKYSLERVNIWNFSNKFLYDPFSSTCHHHPFIHLVDKHAVHVGYVTEIIVMSRIFKWAEYKTAEDEYFIIVEWVTPEYNPICYTLLLAVLY